MKNRTTLRRSQKLPEYASGLGGAAQVEERQHQEKDQQIAEEPLARGLGARLEAPGARRLVEEEHQRHAQAGGVDQLRHQRVLGGRRERDPAEEQDRHRPAAASRECAAATGEGGAAAAAAAAGSAGCGGRGSARAGAAPRAATIGQAHGSRAKRSRPTTARATMTAAKAVARLSERQSSIVSPQTQWVPLEMSQMAKAAIAASRIQGERKLVPARRLVGLRGAARRRALALRRADDEADQEREHADDHENDHRLDEDCRSLLQGRPRPFPFDQLGAAFAAARAQRPLPMSASTHLQRLSLAVCSSSSPRERPGAGRGDGGFAHGRAVGTQLSDDLDGAAVGAVAYDLEAPGGAVGVAQAGQCLAERAAVAVRCCRRRRARRRAATGLGRRAAGGWTTGARRPDCGRHVRRAVSPEPLAGRAAMAARLPCSRGDALHALAQRRRSRLRPRSPPPDRRLRHRPRAHA